MSLPADTPREGLELLVNNLRGTVSNSPRRLKLDVPSLGAELGSLLQADDPLPFSFHLTLPENTAPSTTADPDADPRIAIHNSIHADLLLKHSSLVSTEDIFVVECEPEAVFRVREITRCSSSLDGESSSD